MKQFILNILHFLEYQVTHDKCTEAELRSFYDMASEHLQIDAEAKDIAEHFSQPTANVRNVISRGYLGKPKRRVLYNFMQFLKIVPKSWRK